MCLKVYKMSVTKKLYNFTGTYTFQLLVFYFNLDKITISSPFHECFIWRIHT